MKEFLSQRGVGYREVDVSRDRAAAQELINKTGQLAVPVTVIDGQVIVGFNRPALEQALSQTERPSFGASVADAAKVTAQRGEAVMAGAYVGSLKPGSPAGRLGLAPGDIIIEMNRFTVASATDLEQVISRSTKEGRFTVTFRREGQTLTREGAW